MNGQETSSIRTHIHPHNMSLCFCNCCAYSQRTRNELCTYTWTSGSHVPAGSLESHSGESTCAVLVEHPFLSLRRIDFFSFFFNGSVIAGLVDTWRKSVRQMFSNFLNSNLFFAAVAFKTLVYYSNFFCF